MHQNTFNIEEIERQLAEKKEDERRKTKERIFLSTLVICCMAALYVVFLSMGAGSHNEFIKEVNKPQNMEMPLPKEISLHVVDSIAI